MKEKKELRKLGTFFLWVEGGNFVVYLREYFLCDNVEHIIKRRYINLWTVLRNLETENQERPTFPSSIKGLNLSQASLKNVPRISVPNFEKKLRYMIILKSLKRMKLISITQHYTTLHSNTHTGTHSHTHAHTLSLSLTHTHSPAESTRSIENKCPTPLGFDHFLISLLLVTRALIVHLNKQENKMIREERREKREGRGTSKEEKMKYFNILTCYLNKKISK